MQKTDKKIGPNANQSFGLIMAFAFFILGVLIPFAKQRPVVIPLVAVAVFFLFSALLCPGFLEKPRAYWLHLGELLGRINSTIILTAIYLVLFSLTRFIFFLLRRDRMKRMWKKYPSTFQEKTEISSFRDPF